VFALRGRPSRHRGETIVVVYHHKEFSPVSGFSDLGLSSEVLAAAEALGYTEPTPIQAQAIPLVSKGRDVIGQAQTGSGKTAAFGLPAIDYVDPAGKDVQAIILVPTRELAIQVAQAMRTFGELSGIRVVAVFGGQPIREQTEQLRSSPHIAVGTPGRVMDLIRRGWLPLHDARYVVLDEADEMLSLGFLEDVEWILKQAPAGRQTLLFSATMPPPIRRLAERFLHSPELVKIESATLTVDRIRQAVITVEPREKLDALIALIKSQDPKAAIIFRKRKVGVDELADQLRARGIDVSALHGGMTQGQRDSVMLRFRSGRAKLLVATNVAARGLDISHVSHVISYDIPDDPEEYTHRIGRTGRVDRTGIAYTFAGPKDGARVEEIEKATGATIERIALADITKKRTDLPARDEVAATAPSAPEAAPAAAPIVIETPHEQAPAAPHKDPSNGSPAASGQAATRLFVGAGRRHGASRDDVAGLVTETGVDPLRVKVHHAFSFVDVPTAETERVIAALSEAELGGRKVNVELAERQPDPEPATA
jgi:ATP-dependent RNA helicase DeaD